MKDLIVAIDLGTSGTRALAYTRDTRVVTMAYHEFPTDFPKPGWVEQDPDAIWDTTFRALREVLDKVGRERVACIGITNQRETTLLWERATGRALGPAIVWQDRRTEALCRSLSSSQKFVREKTGLLIDPYFSASKLLWRIQNDSSLAGAMADGKICFGTPDVWLLWKLTSGKVFATEPSNASRTLLFNLRSFSFDDDLLRLFSVPRAVLPDVRPSDSHFGDTDASITGVPIPIHGILGDQQAALLAQGAWHPGIVKNTYGTGLFLLTNTGTDVLMTEKLLSTVAWQRGPRVHYAIEGSVLMGGAILQWLRDQLKILPSYAEAESMAASVTENEGVYFVPALQGLGAPHWDAEARGTIVGLTRKTSRETLVRAALEAMAYQSRDVVDAMAGALGRPIERLRVDGGASKNQFLMQFQSDVLGIPIERPSDVETTALGAAAIAGLGAGIWSESELLPYLKPEAVFQPKLGETERQTLYAGWTAAVQKARTRLP
jgi:glycerol kinase